MIIGPKTIEPILAALRMQCWALMLQASNYEIEYRKSEDHENADALSRAPPLGESITGEPGIFQMSYFHDLLDDPSDIPEKKRRDPVLSRVLEYVLTGWTVHVNEDLLVNFTKWD